MAGTRTRLLAIVLWILAGSLALAGVGTSVVGATTFMGEIARGASGARASNEMIDIGFWTLSTGIVVFLVGIALAIVGAVVYAIGARRTSSVGGAADA